MPVGLDKQLIGCRFNLTQFAGNWKILAEPLGRSASFSSQPGASDAGSVAKRSIPHINRRFFPDTYHRIGGIRDLSRCRRSYRGRGCRNRSGFYTQ
jgi:hypothetical protein